MNTRELENAILLRDSGELSEAETRALEKELATNPALASLVEENRVLQAAGPFSSAEVVPALSEVSREKILQAVPKPGNSRVKLLLAIAALLVLGFGMLPHLSRIAQPAPPVLTTMVDPIRSDFESDDPLLDTLEELAQELALWSGVEMKDPAFLEDENDWAATLITQEDSI